MTTFELVCIFGAVLAELIAFVFAWRFPRRVPRKQSNNTSWNFLFWGAPILFGTLVSGLLGAAAPETQPLSQMLFSAVYFSGMLLITHYFSYGYVFQCFKCNEFRDIFPRWWRRGVFWCPKCEALYMNGKL